MAARNSSRSMPPSPLVSHRQKFFAKPVNTLDKPFFKSFFFCAAVITVGAVGVVLLREAGVSGCDAGGDGDCGSG